MSDQSFKRTLELLEGKQKQSKRKQNVKTKNPFLREPSPPKVTLSSIIKSKKKSKQITKQLPQSSRAKNVPTAHGQMKSKRSKVEENVKKLLMFSSPVNIDSESTQKLIKRAQTQKYVISEPKTKVEHETVFTEEDFRKFEREYFCS